MKNRNVLMMVIVVMVLLFVPQIVMARGAVDSNGQTGNPMMEKFEEIITEVEAGNLGGSEAVLELNQFRESLRLEKREEHRLMESCIDAISSGEMTREEARVRLREASDGEEKEKLREEEQTREREQIQDGTGDREQIREEKQLREKGK